MMSNEKNCSALQAELKEKRKQKNKKSSVTDIQTQVKLSNLPHYHIHAFCYVIFQLKLQQKITQS